MEEAARIERKWKDEDRPNISQLHELPNALFCEGTVESIESSAHYLNTVMEGLGYSSIAGLGAVPYDLSVIAQVMNLLWAITQRQQKESALLRQQEETTERLARDVQTLTHTKHALQERVIHLEKEVTWQKNKARAQKQDYDGQKAQWEQEKKHLNHQIVSLQRRDTQYVHEMRKKEREYERLKDRLKQMVTERKKENLASMNLLRSVRIPKSAVGGPSSDPSSLLGSIVQRYEKKEEVLRQENTLLRRTTYELHKQVTDLLSFVSGLAAVGTNAHIDGEKENAANPIKKTNVNDPNLTALYKRVETSLPRMNSTRIALLGGDESAKAETREESKQKKTVPFHLLQDSLENDVRKDVALLRNVFSSLHEHYQKAPLSEHNKQAPTSSEKPTSIHSVDKQLIEQQQKLIDIALVQKEPLSPRSSLDTSRSEELRQQLLDEHALFEEKNLNFQQERDRLTQAAMQLCRDRLEFENERHAFKNQFNHWQQGLSNKTPIRSSKALVESVTATPTTPNMGDISFEIYTRSKQQQQQEQQGHWAASPSPASFTPSARRQLQLNVPASPIYFQPSTANSNLYSKE
ncbi:hypothetical protein QOT17_011531 [Balamuthia mandrillaris]